MKWTMVLLALAASTGDTARVKHKSKDEVVEQALGKACPSLEDLNEGRMDNLEACMSEDKDNEDDKELKKQALKKQKTKQGCSCKTPCSPQSTGPRDLMISKLGPLLSQVNPDIWRCDFCRTDDKCGHWSLRGRWDYCDYPKDEDFENQPFENKNEYFWDKIIANRARGNFPVILPIFTESMQTVFDNMKDEMPVARKKYIHSIGSICKFELDIKAKSQYTGIFAQGKQEGFIRMGSALPPTDTGLTPGLGFKFARKGVHSGGFVGLYSLVAGTTWNFFEKTQSNHIAAPKGAIMVLAKKFMQASQCSAHVGLSDLARYSQDGTEHKDPKFPFKLFMVPSQKVQMTVENGMPAMTDGKWTIDQVHTFMDKFEVGTPLYKVYACDKPKTDGAELNPTDGSVEDACEEATELGDMVTTSECTTSSYGDKEFHIRHQRIEEDWELRPEFLTTKGYDIETACAASGSPTANGIPPVCGASGSSLFEASEELSGQLDSDLDASNF